MQRMLRGATIDLEHSGSSVGQVEPKGRAGAGLTRTGEGGNDKAEHVTDAIHTARSRAAKSPDLRQPGNAIVCFTTADYQWRGRRA